MVVKELSKPIGKHLRSRKSKTIIKYAKKKGLKVKDTKMNKKSYWYSCDPPRNLKKSFDKLSNKILKAEQHLLLEREIGNHKQIPNKKLTKIQHLVGIDLSGSVVSSGKSKTEKIIKIVNKLKPDKILLFVREKYVLIKPPVTYKKIYDAMGYKLLIASVYPSLGSENVYFGTEIANPINILSRELNGQLGQITLITDGIYPKVINSDEIKNIINKDVFPFTRYEGR